MRRQSHYSPGLVDHLRSHDLLHLFDGQGLQDEGPVPFIPPIEKCLDEVPEKHCLPSDSFLAENALQQRRSSHAKQPDANWRNEKHCGCAQHPEGDGRINGVPRLSSWMGSAIYASIVRPDAVEE